MIIDNTYFIDEIFIPHAKPSVTGDLTSVPGDMISFINTYEAEALIKCLGYQLSKEFSEQLDSTKSNGLKDAVDQKWDDLLNGAEYTDASGKTVYWPGIRRKNGNAYNKSFLAEYIYFFYEKSNDDDRAGIGNVKQESKNAILVSKTPKVIAAWRRFIEQVQGLQPHPSVFATNHLDYRYANNIRIGIDWFGNGKKTKSLYEFIKDKNLSDSTTYSNFDPTYFHNQNQFGI